MSGGADSDSWKAFCRSYASVFGVEDWMRMLGHSISEPEGVKHDEGKLDLTLIPPALLEETARVLMHGAAKYDRHNWTKVPDAEHRYAAALLRHVLAWQRGEILDPETGLHHLAHAACSIAFLLAFAQAGRETGAWRVEVPHQLEHSEHYHNRQGDQ